MKINIKNILIIKYIINIFYIMSKNTSKDLYLEDKRTIFDLDDKDVNYKQHIFGFLLYIVIFVILIPYLLIKYKYWNTLSAYIPNLDLIASTIGYHGGPFNSYIWTHLYNPANSTITGYVTSNVINLFALLGVTYIIAHFTFVKKNIYQGWSRAFIMLPMTYFIPSNIIIYFMNIFGKYLNKFYLSKSIIHYLLVIVFGLILIIGLILAETELIELLGPFIIKLLKFLY